MARVDLQCECGHKFFVAEEQLSVHRLAPCPACDANVKAPGAAKPGAPKPAAPKAAAKPAAPKPAAAPVEFIDEAPEGGSKKKLYMILGGAGAGVILLVVILAIAFSGPKVDYEKEAAKALEERKKAFQEISSKPSTPAPAPAPAPAPPVKPPPAAAQPKTSSELRAQRPALPTPPPPAQAQPGAPVAPAAGPAKPGAVALNADALIRVRTDVLALHPFYMALVLTPAEKTRLDGIVATGQGQPDDADFIQALLTGGKLKSVRDEIGLIVQTLPTVDRESQEGLPVDKVTLTDGRVMNCRILDEGTDVVKVSRTLAGGVGGQLPLRRENITRIEKGKGIGTEFTTRWESAQKGSLASQVELLGWCKENTLTGQAKLVAYTILRGDPSNTQARAEAGLPADPVKMAEEVARGGVIAWQGRNWPAKELKEKLLKDGNTLLDGQWYTKKERMIVVPGLFRYERQNDKPVNIGGGNGLLCHDVETVYKTVQDVNSNTFVETPEVRYTRRFYAPQMVVGLTGRVPPGVIPPASTYELDVRLNVDDGLPPAGTPMKADVVINVPVGEPIIEASVITTAEVKAGGSITVYHYTGSGDAEKRTKLYTCDPKESGSHTIPPELIRGLTDVNLVAVIESPAAYIQKVERRHARAAIYKGKQQISPAVDVVHYRMIPDYKAVLFPSNSNTIEVFRLKVAVAEAAPNLNKLFANNLDLLK